MLPIAILCGPAGSGKDVAGKHIADNYRGVCIGQADPLKWIARDVFQFTSEQLFGPSECRNAIDTRYIDGNSEREHALVRSQEFGPLWCQRLFPAQEATALKAFFAWFAQCMTWADKNGGLSPRFSLQTLGTEWGRSLDTQVWVRYAVKTAKTLLAGGYSYNREHGMAKKTSTQEAAVRDPQLVIITDGRFKNEMLEVKAAGGIAVKVERISNLSAAAQAAGVQGHQSEAELGMVPPHYYDFVIVNDRRVEDLLNKAEYVAHTLLAEPRRI